MVDIVPAADPGDADLHLDLSDTTTSEFADTVRQHLGLPPRSAPGLTPEDIRQLAADIDRATMTSAHQPSWADQHAAISTPQSPPTSPTPTPAADSSGDRSPHIEAGGARRPRNAYDTEAQDAWANNAYDHFRNTDNDLDGMVAELADVPRPDGSTGFGRAELERIKNHLFREVHPLSITDDDGKDIGIEYRRYDAYADIAEAWIRMSLGRATPDDIVLLEHELAEAQYYESHPGAPYQEAHQFANLSFNWEAMQHARTGENIDEWRSVYGNVSGLPTGVGDRPGSDVPVRRGGPQSQSDPDDQQGGLLGDGGGREGGRDGRENSGHSDDSSPSGRGVDQGGQLPSLNYHSPRQSGGHSSAGGQLPNSPSSAPSPSPESVPHQGPATTAVPPPTSPTSQQVRDANQSRIARDNLRRHQPDGGVQPVTDSSGNRRFTLGRFTSAFNQPVSMLRIGLHVSGTSHLDPALVQALIDRAQFAVDLRFNGGIRLPSGDWMMVDLVPVSDPAAADMTIDLDTANPHSTPTDANLDNLTAMLREQLGLDPSTESELSPGDVQRISNEIDHAVPSSTTSPRVSPGPVTTDSPLDLPAQAASPASRPDSTAHVPNIASAHPSSARRESPNQTHPHTPIAPNNQSQIPPRAPDHRAPESTPPPVNASHSTSPTGSTNSPSVPNNPDFTPQTPQWHQSWGAPNPSQRSTGSIRRMVRKLFGAQPSRNNVPSAPPPTPTTQRPSSVAPGTPPDTNSPQQTSAPENFSDLPYSVGPPYTTQEMNPTYRGEHEVGNSVWPNPLRVSYLDEIARRRLRLHVIDGRIYDADGNLFDTSSGTTAWGGAGRAIFVMDEHGNLYASNYHERGLFHHSSFLSGGNVAAAGELIVINGEIQMVTDSSGHYQPSRGHTMQAINQLRNMGIPITPQQVEFKAPPQ
ncbi:hypothetical protein ACTWPB_17770 [Nocardia sp. IBHARD005]|uniref:hypothetical protein n=1 Tax=Nocardia sp. IBHARD005 TaxID=3457765 RepID=UPI00405A2E3D